MTSPVGRVETNLLWHEGLGQSHYVTTSRKYLFLSTQVLLVRSVPPYTNEWHASQSSDVAHATRMDGSHNFDRVIARGLEGADLGLLQLLHPQVTKDTFRSNNRMDRWA